MRNSETFEVEKVHTDFLQGMVEEYDLEDTSKALRILLDYAMSEDIDTSEIFEEVRCLRCD